jgi:hypothetical protein
MMRGGSVYAADGRCSTRLLAPQNVQFSYSSGMDLPSISMPALVFLGIAALVLGARFGGRRQS